MDTSLYADPNCKKCNGKGRVHIGEGITEWAVCRCALFGQHRAAAELFITKTFPEKAREMTLATFQTGGIQHNEQALQVARNFVDNFLQAKKEGWVVGFWGEPRAGKTHIALGIAQACTKRFLVKPVLFNVPKALRLERERFKDDSIESPFEKAIKADLLIIDDLGAQYERQGTDQVSWVTEQLYTLIDERYMHNKPIIYTTNYSPSDMRRRMNNESGKRVLSRLEHAQVVAPIEVKVVEGLQRKNKEAANLLLSKRS